MMLNNLVAFPITLSSPGAVAFLIGNWPVRWYGILTALGFIAIYLVAEKLVKGNKLSLDHFSNLIFLILIFSIVFARLYFVALSWDYFKDHLSEIPMIWHGGQSVHGGMIGAILAAILYTRLKRISFFSYMDILCVGAPLGQAIGRWGNFFNNEAFGKPVKDFFIRLYIPDSFSPDKYINEQYFHPTFLYESVLDFGIFIFLYNKYSLWGKSPGKILWTYLLSYSIVRFFLEFLRVDSLYLFNCFASAHIVSIIIIVVSVLFLCRGRPVCLPKK